MRKRTGKCPAESGLIRDCLFLSRARGSGHEGTGLRVLILRSGWPVGEIEVEQMAQECPDLVTRASSEAPESLVGADMTKPSWAAPISFNRRRRGVPPQWLACGQLKPQPFFS